MVIADAIIEGLSMNHETNTQLFDFIFYLNDPDKCFYCKRKPQMICSVYDKRAQIMGDQKLNMDQKIVKLRYGHLLLDKEPEKQLSTTTQAMKNQSYNENFCVYITASLLNRVIRKPFGDFLNNQLNVPEMLLKAARHQKFPL